MLVNLIVSPKPWLPLIFIPRKYAWKSPQHFEGPTTNECAYTLMKIAYKVSGPSPLIITISFSDKLPWLVTTHWLHQLKISGKPIIQNLCPEFLSHFQSNGKTWSWPWLALKRQCALSVITMNDDSRHKCTYHTWHILRRMESTCKLRPGWDTSFSKR